MTKAQLQVQQFRRKMGLTDASPNIPELRSSELCARLILEEAFETVIGLVGDRMADYLSNALRPRAWPVGVGPEVEPDLIESVDGLCDLIYVCLNAAECIGIDLEPFFDAVHDANMQKTPLALNAHGKRGGKPEGWKDPKVKISAMLENLR